MAELDIVRNGEKQTLSPEFKDTNIKPETN